MKMLAMRRESDQFYGHSNGNFSNTSNSNGASNNFGTYTGNYQQQG